MQMKRGMKLNESGSGNRDEFSRGCCFSSRKLNRKSSTSRFHYVGKIDSSESFY